MSAPMLASSAGKIIFQKSHFQHPKSQHVKVVTEHWFNAAVDVTIPNSGSLPASSFPDIISQEFDTERFSLLYELPIICLIRQEFIENFVKQGHVYILSHGTHLDEDDTICIIPTGHLILNVGKDTYESLGLEGKQSVYDRKKTRKYVVTIDLTAPYFKPGRKFYERVSFCMRKWNRKFDLLLQWVPFDADICPSSVLAFLSQVAGEGCRYDKHKLTCTENKYTDTRIPVIDGEDHVPDEDDESSTNWEDFYTWLGCKACGVTTEGEADNYINSFSCSEPNLVSSLSVHRYTGFISSQTILSLLDKLRDYLPSSEVPWLSMTVYGFDDSPVSWKQKEHGYLKSGENLYTFIVFPDGTYWLISTLGTYDQCP